MEPIRKTAMLLLAVAITAGLAYVLAVQVGNYLSRQEKAGIGDKSIEQTLRIIDRMGTVQVGDTLTDFVLDDIDGHRHQLSELVDVRSTIMYLDPDCSACRNQLSEYSLRVTDPTQHRNFIIISPSDPNYLKDVRDYYGLLCPILVDNDAEFASDLNILTSPFNLMVDNNLEILEISSVLVLPEENEMIIDVNE